MCGQGNDDAAARGDDHMEDAKNGAVIIRNTSGFARVFLTRSMKSVKKVQTPKKQVK